MREQTTLEASRRKALPKAMDLFWARGAEIASYSELVVATGLSRKALYQIWPDKQTLIRDTLSTYRREYLDPVLTPLGLGGKKGLAAFWDQLEGGAKGEGWRGCYLFRTSCGALRQDPFVVETLNTFLDLLAESIARAVKEGQAAGEISPEIDADAAGWQVVAINVLISTLGAQCGYDDRIARLYQTARRTCGL